MIANDKPHLDFKRIRVRSAVTGLKEICLLLLMLTAPGAARMIDVRKSRGGSVAHF